MKHSLSVLFTAFFLLVSIEAAASTDTTFFPPMTTQNLECGQDQLRIITWAQGQSTTICLTGQEFLSLAIPTCASGQHVVYDGGKYICRTPKAIPSCGTDEYLSYDGSSYVCKPTVLPVCTSNQVMTNSGNGFQCIDKNNNIPVCASNQLITFDGTAYRCAKNEKVSPPSCGNAQYVWAEGSLFICRDLPASKP